jgi:hypothetical protein
MFSISFDSKDNGIFLAVFRDEAMEKLGKAAMISDGERGLNSWACPPNGKGRSVNIFNSFILDSRAGADGANLVFDVPRSLMRMGAFSRTFLFSKPSLFLSIMY